jgi:hypothetical protein
MHRNVLLRILADLEQRLALYEAELADRHARLVELERAGQDRWKAIQAIAGLRITQGGHERRREIILRALSPPPPGRLTIR